LANIVDDDTQYLLAYISDKVQDVRGHGADAKKEYAVLLDGGDIYQGNTLSSRFNGSSLSAAYNLMGYDAVALGNHEFD
jgi:2',3'-cyclic-nucleotide 2'-phosphodiesterase (5'-nucleotidase family)